MGEVTVKETDPAHVDNDDNNGKKISSFDSLIILNSKFFKLYLIFRFE